jgi:serine/threonine protein kinase
MTEEFGPYRLEHLLGRGGMGEVHRAWDTRRGRTIALKRLPAPLAGDPEFQARFRRESALAAQLSEPHIIPIHDFGEINGRLFIDMRLVDGTDLASVIKSEGPMAPRRAIGILAQVASALDAAHAAGLVHRDVKPSNVLVRGHDEDEFAYLIDFGIARAAAGQASGPALTVTGATLGTLDYMAPERFENRPVDGRADVYSLACMLFELLTGAAPFRGRTPVGMIHAHVTLDPPRPSAQRPGLPPGLDDVVVRGMAKRPERRYPTAGALVAAARAAVRAEGRSSTAQTPLSLRKADASSPQPAPLSDGRPSAHTPRAATSGAWASAQTPPPDGWSPAQAPSSGGWAPNPPLAHIPPPGGWPRTPPPASWPSPAQRPWPPTTAPARPGGMVVAFVLQLISGSVFAIGSLVSFIGASIIVAAIGMTLASVAYILCALKAFGGVGWARITLALVNGLFAVFCLVVIVYGLNDASSTTTERVGGAALLLLLAGMAVACTVPMFTQPARRYVAARAAR